MNGGWVFLIILLLLGSGSYFGWYFYARWNANKNGLPPPSMNPITAFKASRGGASNYPGPAPSGIKGFIETQIHKFKNRNNRSAAGAYEGDYSATGGSAPRGRGANSRLDPDEAWSSRVGDEAYYEEQELGLHEPARGANPYAAATNYAPQPHEERGRSRTRDSYDEHLDSHGARTNDPFADDHAASLRGVSPRPLHYGDDTSYHGGATAQMPQVPQIKTHKKAGSVDSADSPTESRRSVFREAI
ncbi:hypothetical protein N0V94_008258 [Neodidymelliopsis sp. IMI 364377]|nr:hypothetical protein N0V94_008258 [Neodidymelliopsis sp. IMI 364377]